ncbi:MAG TPA: HAD-IA family hydrolase [Gemmatimonadaceae bacterium]|nr:HAD-IA family hydrolase [Gemmatimonadaceae bacterium]
MALTHIFFDIGGVLGSNGWDHEQRGRAEAHFDLGPEFENRHHELVGDWEIGRLSLDEYLDSAVFFEPRSFTKEEFIAFMFGQSEPFFGTIAIVADVAKRGDLALMTLNNEADELNRHRIASFGLNPLFEAFLSSCWLGVRKPSHVIFERAMAIAGAEPGAILFVDDRRQNLVPAAAAGWQTHHFIDAAGLRLDLEERGIL